jgi:manganese-dependent inorganic pyrophosphatase
MAGRIVVIGHKNPDTDSICAAVAFAELLRHLRPRERVVAGRAGDLRPETSYLLERFEVEPPELVRDVRVRVGDVMTSDCVTVNERDSLYQVGHTQVGLGMRPLPVVDDAGRLCGIAEAQDFAKVFFEGLEADLADQIPIDLDNVASALDARVLVAAPDRRVRDRVIVAASSLETVVQRLEPEVVLVVGDRVDVQRAAIERGVGALIVTGDIEVDPAIVALAQRRRVTLMSVPHHTAATLRLIQMSIPISYIMRRDPPSAEPDDLVDDVRNLLGQERALSVVDDASRVVGVITRADVLRGARQRVALVDHNERSQAVDGIEQADVVAIVDHHRVADLQTVSPPMMRVEPVGATSTVVAKLFDESAVPIVRPLAGILLGAILTDTLLFKSPTTTAEDRRVAAGLAEIAGVDPHELGRTLITRASDVSHRTARELVTGDFKAFNLDGQRFGVGVIETASDEAVLERRRELLKAMREVRDDEYQSVLLVVTDIVHERTTILVDGHREAIAQALGGTVKGGEIQLAGVYSRKKQIVPALPRIRELIATGRSQS